MKNKQTILYLFLLVSLIFIYADHQGNQLLIYLTKPLLMTILAIYFYLSVKSKLDTFCRYILLALIFSVLGDSFLMLPSDSSENLNFMLGLGSFLFTHIFYILAFLNASRKRGKGFLQRKPFWAIPLLILLIANTAFLWSDIPGSLRIPVAIYSQAIIFMTLVGFNLKGQISTKAFTLLITGSLLFVFSDCMIALVRFKADQLYIPLPRLLIMVPYLVGQYLLIMGSLMLVNSK